MKKNIFGIMMIGMILGTTTVFGKTNVKPGMNKNRMEMRGNGPRKMGGPRMDKPMPIPEHRHEFCGPGHRCHFCGITEHEWHMILDNGMHKPIPKPMHKTMHKPMPHHFNR